jgi:hypothetical protein
METITDTATPAQAPAPRAPPRLLYQVHARIQMLRYSIRTEQAYRDCI